MTAVVYGLTDDGFIPKPLTVLRTEMGDALRGAFGASIDLGDLSLLGILLGIIAERLALLWELIEAVIASQDPDKATGVSLGAVSALTGTIKPSARPSTVALTLFGAPGTLVQSVSRFKTASTGLEFTTDRDTTIELVDAWAAETTYVLGDRVWSDTSRIYECIFAGTSANSPVAGIDDDILDGSVHWRMIQDNVSAHGAVDVPATASTTGPLTARAGDLTSIVSGVSGLVAVANLHDASPGRDDASNEELRVLREQELAGDGSRTPDALKSKLLRVPGITSVTVFINDTDVVSDGMQAHSVEVLIRTTWLPKDPKDQVIYDLILANVAFGISTMGNQVGSSVDSSGNVHTIRFSRPEEIPIYVDVTFVKNPKVFPADGNTQVKDAIVKLGNAQSAGVNAVASRVAAQVFAVNGVFDVPRTGSIGGVLIGTAPSPTSDATILITKRQQAVYDTSRIVLHASDGVP